MYILNQQILCPDNRKTWRHFRGKSVVPRADDEVVRAISAGMRFFQEWRG